ERANTLPGLLVPATIRPPPSRTSDVTCRAAARVSSVALAGSPHSRKILPSFPVPTRRDPSASISTSNGQSSAASHNVSHRPSGRIRKIAPLGLRGRVDGPDPEPAVTDVVSTTVMPVISAETVGTGARGCDSGDVIDTAGAERSSPPG